MSDIKRGADSSLWNVRRGNEVIRCESRHESNDEYAVWLELASLADYPHYITITRS